MRAQATITSTKPSDLSTIPVPGIGSPRTARRRSPRCAATISAQHEGHERAVVHRRPLLTVCCEVELQSVGDLGQVVMVTIISESAARVSSRTERKRGR
jgi:hypothetical protein